MARLARHEDWPRVLELFKVCHAASVYDDPLCDDSCAILFNEAVKGQQLACFVTPEVDGALFLALTPSHFNLNTLYANELMFWGKGGRELVKAGAEWAKAHGASRLRMASEHHIKGKVMDRWYRREGLSPVGRTYAMELE